MNIRQMLYVLAVAEHRSYTRAAKELFISQPSLSVNVLKAEEELGTPIFDRTSVPLKLTYAGEVYVARAREILDIKRQLDREIQEITKGNRGKLKIGLSIDRLPYLLPYLLKEYGREFPNIEVEATDLFSYEIKEAVMNRKIDFGVIPDCGTLEEELREDIVAEEITSEEIVLAGSKRFIREDHLVAGMENTVDVKKLEDVPLIMLTPESYYRRIVDDLYAESNMSPQIAMFASCNLVAYRLATAGFGAAFVPRMVTQLLKEIQMTPIYSVTPSGLRWKLKVIYHRNLFMGVSEKGFIAALRKASVDLL